MKDAEKFKSDREEQFGGKIQFMTYTRYIGEADSSKLLNRGGILYIINDILHFEDFESSGGIMMLLNQKKEYTKTQFSIDLRNISIIKEIREKNAVDCINGYLNENDIMLAPKGFLGLFTKEVLQVFVKNQPSLFFDFLARDGFMEIVNEFMSRPE